MTLEEAIKTAISYETRIRDFYYEGTRKILDETGKHFFQVLGDDEQHHLDYLEHQLRQWEASGKIDPTRLESTIPSKEIVDREALKIQSEMAKDDRGLKQQMLSKALAIEIETSAFYRQMVEEMDVEARDLFTRFLEIENNHISAVQFELDYISKTGYWFDFKEFDME